MTVTVTHFPAAQRSASPWKNGGGITHEICREPADPTQTFIWRISMADVSKEGPFSEFSGYERVIAVVKGVGMRLVRSQLERSVMLQPFQPYTFNGNDKVYGELPSGAVTDLNVIYHPQHIRTELHFFQRIGAVNFLAADVTVLINLHQKPCNCRIGESDLMLAYQDAVRIDGSSTVTLSNVQCCALIELIHT